MTERIVNVERVEDLISVFGSLDENIHRIEQELGVQILNRGSDLKISGEEEAADKAARSAGEEISQVLCAFTDSEQNVLICKRSDTSSPWSSLEMTTRLPRWPVMWSVLRPRASPSRPRP